MIDILTCSHLRRADPFYLLLIDYLSNFVAQVSDHLFTTKYQNSMEIVQSEREIPHFLNAIMNIIMIA